MTPRRERQLSAPSDDRRVRLIRTVALDDMAPQADDAPEKERVRAYAWRHERLDELEPTAEAVRAAFAEQDTLLWVDLQSPRPSILTEIAGCLGLHPLIVEDIIERNQRAKAELTGEVIHLVMFALLYDAELDEVEIDIVLGRRFLLTTHPPEWDPHTAAHLRQGIGMYLREGPDYLLWAIVDALVDGYFPIFDRLGDEIDELQDDVLERPSRLLVERLFQARRDLLTIRHAIAPEREIFNQLTNRSLTLIREARTIYFRDVYDHLIRLTDELDNHREMVSTTLDAYLSAVNNNLSEVMKRLTSITAILAGIGAAAGIFGMSEAHTVRSEDPSFWFVTLGVLGIGVALYIYFRRIDWI